MIKQTMLFFCLCLWANSSYSAIVSLDWKTPGDNLITRDTDSGMEWLDVNVSLGRSFLEVSSQLGIGGDYEGFRYTNKLELDAFFDHIVQIAGNDITLTRNDIGSVGSAIDSYIEMLGTTGDGLGFLGEVAGLTSIPGVGSDVQAITIQDSQRFNGPRFSNSSVGKATRSSTRGSWLVRDVPSPIPIPAAAWLFGTGLLGLISVGRRKADS